MSKPRTEAQLAAARANGKKSKGPITPMGKRNSSQNARKHRLFVPIVFPGESGPGFHSLSNAIRNGMVPDNPREEGPVQRMITAQWRLRHIRKLEHAALLQQYATLGPAPQVVINGEVYTHESIRAAMAFENVHGRGLRGSPLQQAASRYNREFHRASAELYAIRKKKQLNFTKRPGASL